MVFAAEKTAACFYGIIRGSAFESHYFPGKIIYYCSEVSMNYIRLNEKEISNYIGDSRIFHRGRMYFLTSLWKMYRLMS